MAEFSGKVWLLGNYVLDEQESMQRFANVLLDELTKRKLVVELIRPEPVLRRGKSKWLGYVDKLVIFPRQLKRRLKEFSPGDVLHICDHSNAVYTGVAAKIPHVVTCHDLLAIRSAREEFPQHQTGVTGKIYQRMILKGLNRARRVACVSQNTAADVARLTSLGPNRVTVVHNGLNYPYRPMEKGQAREYISQKRGEPPRRFILHVGGNQWYKNRLGVVRIYRELLRLMPGAPELVMLGKDWPEELRRAVQESGLEGKVHSTLECGNEELRAFYSTADALLFPSLQEGFGWPIIEAQACGCPVATSNRAPMTEVGGEAAIYFNPMDPPAAARAVQTLLVEPADLRVGRAANGIANAAKFSAERMVDRYLEEYATVSA